MNRVLVIESDSAARDQLVDSLRRMRHDVSAESTGAAGLSALSQSAVDILVLHAELPDFDSCQMLRMLRSMTDTPVIYTLTSRNEGRAVRALDVGADSCIFRPCSPELLHAQIRATVRRSHGERQQRHVLGDLVVDIDKHLATLRGRALDLRPREFEVLAYLVGAEERVVSKAELLREIWNNVFGVSEKTIDVHLSWLRKKLGESAVKPRYIRTVRGVGIKVVNPRTAGPPGP
ncbi:response regulator transcription factor [Streptomyces sp. NPDC015131]|uniref:response regulator transcription factor n=1 Tax=Streptomyces sp. NPDC015131 TaxID=3364941 RepID=UPI00370255DE